MSRTRIVATLGPATDRPGVLREIIHAGVDVARLNASHGKQEDHKRRMEEVRAIARELGRPIALLLDLQGPKIRVGRLPTEGIALRPGASFVLSNREHCPDGAAPVDYEPLPREVVPGNIVLLDDGNIALRVEHTDGHDISCIVERGGVLTSNKGINVPGAALSASALAEKDKIDAVFGVEEGVDFLALSFVRRASDVLELRELVGNRVGIIAKIERPEALEDIDAIIAAADGIMVARGDLGVEIPLEQVPAVQRRLLEAANRAGKPAITATQMLESMIEHSRPTRAEATDVYVAVTQLTDAVMLSAETAVGAFPVEAVKAMQAIAAAAESDPALSGSWRARHEIAEDSTQAVAQAACEIAEELHAKAIITATTSGSTARMVARYRPIVPVFAVAHSEATRRRLMLTWGVTSLASQPIHSTDEMIAVAAEMVVAAGLAAPGDLVVITAGVPMGTPGHTNLIKVHRIGEQTT